MHITNNSVQYYCMMHLVCFHNSLKRGSSTGAVQICYQFHFPLLFLNKWTVALLATLHFAMSVINLHNSECAHTLSDTLKYSMMYTGSVWI